MKGLAFLSPYDIINLFFLIGGCKLDFVRVSVILLRQNGSLFRADMDVKPVMPHTQTKRG